jgi:hypothetical protein
MVDRVGLPPLRGKARYFLAGRLFLHFPNLVYLMAKGLPGRGVRDHMGEGEGNV